jgi:alpha-amylase/alpha-mannosidase (GH57 family)
MGYGQSVGSSKTALAIVLLLLAVPLLSIVGIASTPDDVTADGSLSEWDSDTLMATDSNSVSFRLTWNATHLAFAWDGTDWASLTEGADLFVYLNTSDDGSPLSKQWSLSHTLPFAADHAFVLEDSIYSSLQTFNGSTWVDGDQTGIESHTGWSGNKITEVVIPWGNIGNPTSLDIIAWAQWQDAGNVWAAFPLDNPATSDGAETFTHGWHIADRNATTNPSTLPTEEATGVVEKLDDALNLAIVFHQHQPYYKNKLTGMIEMPWVRVHGMTEYVDSPGILSKYPDTKVTYNLVPSFVEQLVEYHRDGTLDVHTDFARRHWPTDANGTVTGLPNATTLELHTMQFQSFWNSGWIYNVTADDAELGWLEPAASRYSELYGMTMHNLKPATIMADELLSAQDFLDLQVLWYLFQFSPDYVLGEYQSIEDSAAAGRPAHYDATLKALYEQNGSYTPADLTYVLDVQEAHLANVLPMYSALAERGQVELTTTPYYHPIMPLLMMDGWTFEDGIRVNKNSWPEDVASQLTNGMDLFEQELGFRPTGMWPSEQAVSPPMVQPVSDVGIQWMITDEVNLAESTEVGSGYIDTDIASNLATPWIATGLGADGTPTGEGGGGEVAVIFRDRVISDRIAFQYGSMTPAAAVSDFIAYIDGVRNELLAEGKDPSEHLLTVALDGENWMFMSEFQHHDGARPFMDEWYSRLGTHPSIVTTTPSEFLAKNLTLPRIDTIGTGSWIDGTLSTWAGEAEESLGWQRLIEARQALVAFEGENPEHSGLETAWESLYIAEGSDWFWWYGLDQDSGYDENWDVLFKVHLSNIYRAIGLELPPYLQDLWTNAAVPENPYSGTIEPMIDGIALPGEWDGAAKYDASSVDGGTLDIDSFYLGYDASNIYVRADLSATPDFFETADLDWAPDISIYFMQPNAVNFNEVQTNFRTYYGNEILGFPAKKMVSFDFNQIREDGKAKWNLFDAQGKIGETEQWSLTSTSILGGCAAAEVYEFRIPWSDLGLAPRYSTRVKVVSSQAFSLSYGDGDDMEIAPPAPAEMVMPDLEQWVTLLDIDDVEGDETGGGGVVYPTASDFAPGAGLFDVTHLKISQSAWNARFELTFAEMTDYWALTNGFSHQIVQIYVDQGDTEQGRTSMLEGANALIHDDWAWEVAISATGEPGAVKAVQADTGETSAKGIEVKGDATSKTVTITVSKSVIGQDIPNYRFVIVAGSQDGFGPGKWRDVDAVAKTWRLGGGADPSDVDGIDYDPNVLDLVLDADDENAEAPTQSLMLGAYDVDAQQFAVLTGIELPEVAQQIFGAKFVSSTSSSAILEWSTTRDAGANITCGSLSFEDFDGGLSHTLQLTGLQADANYECAIVVEGADSVHLSFNTSAEVDLTPPEILNLAAEVLSDNRIRITWYTSEESAENITISGESFQGDQVAIKKNHDLTIVVVLSPGDHTLEVTATDASGNANSSSTSVTIEVDEQNSSTDEQPISEQDEPPCATTDTCEEENSPGGLVDLLKSPLVQIGLLAVALLVVGALIRTRRHNY